MSEREARIRNLLADIRTHEAVADAFLAKSFTDRLLILDVDAGDGVPDEIASRLGEHGFDTAESVYGATGNRTSGLGDVGTGTRYHFVDTETRGRHQSYVVE